MAQVGVMIELEYSPDVAQVAFAAMAAGPFARRIGPLLESFDLEPLGPSPLPAPR